MIVSYAPTLLPRKLHASRVLRRIEERLRVRFVLQVRIPEHQRDRSNRAERTAVADRPAAVVVLRYVVENLSGARIDDRRFAGALVLLFAESDANPGEVMWPALRISTKYLSPAGEFSYAVRRHSGLSVSLAP